MKDDYAAKWTASNRHSKMTWSLFFKNPFLCVSGHLVALAVSTQVKDTGSDIRIGGIALALKTPQPRSALGPYQWPLYCLRLPVYLF